MTADTARIVLTHRTLRWSSPIVFNDPFDVPRELAYGVEPEELGQAVVARLLSMIEQPLRAPSKLPPRVMFTLDAVKRAPPDLRRKIVAEIGAAFHVHRPSSAPLDEFREQWRALLPTFRILCLTESPTHAAMWLHYADRYRGAVVEFECSDELDSAWLTARPVRYLDNTSKAFSADGWATYLLMPQRQAIEAILDDCTYTKSADWSYEKEWRITSWMRATDTGLFTDYEFRPAEVSAVYLGPMMAAADKGALIAAAACLPNARVVKVQIGMSGRFLFSDIAAPRHQE